MTDRRGGMRCKKRLLHGDIRVLEDRQGELSCNCDNVQMTHTDNKRCKRVSLGADRVTDI